MWRRSRVSEEHEDLKNRSKAMKTRATNNLDAEEAALLQASERGDFRIKAATAAVKGGVRRVATATLRRGKRKGRNVSLSCYHAA
jgi:hypothetical protein